MNERARGTVGGGAGVQQPQLGPGERTNAACSPCSGTVQALGARLRAPASPEAVGREAGAKGLQGATAAVWVWWMGCAGQPLLGPMDDSQGASRASGHALVDNAGTGTACP